MASKGGCSYARSSSILNLLFQDIFLSALHVFLNSLSFSIESFCKIASFEDLFEILEDFSKATLACLQSLLNRNFGLCFFLKLVGFVLTEFL